MTVYTQDPDSKLDWQHTWTDWLAEGDSISTRQWSITPEGPTLANDTGAIVTLSGLTRGKVYRLTESIVTANGFEADRTITIRCVEK